MNKKNILIIGCGIVLLLLAISIERLKKFENFKSILDKDQAIQDRKFTNFKECSDAGNRLIESYPRQCVTINGDVYEEVLGNVFEKADFVVIESPRPNALVTSPLHITGRARGTWFFEANVPISVVNWDGLIIGEGYGVATEEWMTEDFVPFEADINFTFDPATAYDRGILIVRRANPSALPENDDSLEFPIRF